MGDCCCTIHRAAIDGDAEEVTRLIEEDPSIVHSFGRTALHLTSEYGHAAVAVCLLDGGDDINQQERYGSCFTPLLKACCAGDLRMVNLLLDRGADPSICSSCGRPPVFFATVRGDVEMVRSLLRHEGARLTTIDFHPAAAGTTALGVGCSQHRTVPR